MYSASHQVSAPVNGMAGDVIDGSGTINPAALNTPASLSAPNTAPSITSPRGVKRSRSPDQYGDLGADGGEHDDHSAHPDEHGRRKRGRPPKLTRPSSSSTANAQYATSNTQSHLPQQQNQQQQPSTIAGTIHTPQLQAQNLPSQTSISPPQHSPPPKTTPTKSTVKALPTVRDHTTDTLNEGRDEYIPKDWDDAGEKKVDAMGYLQDGRVYKCRTFRVPNRAEKLFMLATECARVLGYRDSYLLFNKNRSLYKIIASQVEKDDLIQQDILPYSYRSRQIAIVTARSMFRQFGSRVIVNGRRVRDDYWESKARKQGFTEDDLAGEKRPGAAKARDAAAAAAEAAATSGILPGLGQSDIVYSNAIEGMPHMPPGIASHQGVSLAPLPMIHLAPTTDDPRLREYSSMPRQRQEMTGQPYQDRAQSSTAAEIHNQATHTAEFNKILNSQRAYRQKGLEEFYATPREAPASSPSHVDVVAAAAAAAPVSQPLQSPQMMTINPTSQQHRNVLAGQQQTHVMTPPNQNVYNPQNPPSHVTAQSPLSNSMHGIRPDALHSRTPNTAALSSTASQNPPYGYQSQSQPMWGHPPPQPQHQHQQPTLSASPHMGMPQYAGQIPQQSPSPHPGSNQQPHPSQSPHNQARPTQPMPQGIQMHPQVGQPGMASMAYQGGGVAYSNVANPRAMYAQAQPPNQQQFVPTQSTGMNMMGAGVGIQGWPSSAGGHMQSGQPQQGQSGSPLGGWSGY